MGTLVLRDPSGAVVDLTIKRFAEDGYQRSLIQRLRLGEISAAGTPVLEGANSTYYSWTIAAYLSLSDALLFDYIVRTQDARYASSDSAVRADAPWILRDLIDPIVIDGRTAISGTQVTDPVTSVTYANFAANVKIQIPESHRVPSGMDATGRRQYLIQFGAIEIP